MMPIAYELVLICAKNWASVTTQAVIYTCSKSKYYSGNPEDDTLPEAVATGDRDEIGIIWAICVKVGVSTFFYPSFLMCWVGMLFLTTQAALQDPSRVHEYTPLLTVARYESTLEFNICYAHSCRVSTPSKWLMLFMWYPITLMSCRQLMSSFVSSG